MYRTVSLVTKREQRVSWTVRERTGQTESYEVESYEVESYLTRERDAYMQNCEKKNRIARVKKHLEDIKGMQLEMKDPEISDDMSS